MTSELTTPLSQAIIQHLRIRADMLGGSADLASNLLYISEAAHEAAAYLYFLEHFKTSKEHTHVGN